jgi:hypothetical protein
MSKETTDECPEEARVYIAIYECPSCQFLIFTTPEDDPVKCLRDGCDREWSRGEHRYNGPV